MPFTKTIDILKDAKEKGYGVGAYNVLSLDQAVSIIKLCDRLKAPVLITIPAVIEPYVSFADLGSITKIIAEKVSIPVGLHLSHGKDIATLNRCIDAGFTSVMIDGSVLPFDDNVKLTQEAVKLCHESGVACEGEIGSIGSGSGDIKGVMTNPEDARRYVDLTNVDIFAVSIGNAHGFYKGIPKIDFERFNDIKTALKHKENVFFTLHGGTGVSPNDLKRLVLEGCLKICIYTEMCGRGKEKAFDYLAKHPEYAGTFDVPELFKAILGGFLDVVEEDIEIFNTANKVSISSQLSSVGSINDATIEEIVRKVMKGL